MPDYSIEQKADELNIRLTDVGSQQGPLLAAFQRCQDGSCTCPTDEYRKLASFDVDADEDAIAVRLTSAPGARLGPEANGRCVRYTLDRSASGADLDE